MKRIRILTLAMVLSALSLSGFAWAEEVRWPASMNPMLPISIVGIDADTLYYIGNDNKNGEMYTGDFPLPRIWYAKLIESLREARAMVIVVDYVFMPRQPAHTADFSLAKAIATGPPPIVVAFDAIPAASRMPAPGFNLKEFDLNHIQPGSGGMVSAPALALPFADLVKAGASIGSAHQHVDPDGVIRKGPLFVSYGDIVLPSIPLAAFMEATGVMPHEISISGGYMDIRGTKFPLTTEASLDLALPPQKAVFPRMSFKDVVVIKEEYKKTAVADHKNELKKLFEGRIVFIGPTDFSLGDLRKTGAGPLYPSVEVMAATTNHLLNIWTRSRGISKPTWVSEAEDTGEVSIGTTNAPEEPAPTTTETKKTTKNEKTNDKDKSTGIEIKRQK